MSMYGLMCLVIGSQGRRSLHGKGQQSDGHRSGHVQTLSLDSMHIPGSPQIQISPLTLGYSPLVGEASLLLVPSLASSISGH